MMHRLVIGLFVGLLIPATWATLVAAQDTPPDSVVKTVCLSLLGYDELEPLKNDLLTRAKREAANELFGELIASATRVDDLVVTADQIRVQSLGLIRLQGSVTYANGTNLAEVCATITAYTTAQDRAQFEPENVTGRRCVAEPTLSVRQVRAQAEEGARVQALVDYDSGLEEYALAAITPLLRKVEYTESGLLPGTDTYCATVTGEVTPIEILSFLSLGGNPAEIADTTPTAATIRAPTLLATPTPMPAATETMVPTSSPTRLATATPTWTPQPTATVIAPQIDTEPLAGVQLVGPLLLEGNGEPGATLSIEVNGKTAGDVKVDASGRWREVVTISAPGHYVVLVNMVDPDGTLLAVSEGVVLMAALPTATPTDTPTVTAAPTSCADGYVRVHDACATVTPIATATHTPRPTATRTPRPTATRTPRATATWTPRAEPPQRDIQALIDRWDQIHHEADYSLDPSDLHLVLTGAALRQQEETLRDLSRTGCYWDFSDLEPSQLTEWDVVSSDEVEVTMRKHWDGKLYCKGQLDRKRSFTEPFSVRYRIIWTSQGWRIAEKLALD